MYIIERRMNNSNDESLYDSIEVVQSVYIENEHFEQALKKEINKFKDHHGFVDPCLKDSEILRVEFDVMLYRWFMWDYQEDLAPFIFKASVTKPDEFTDTVLNVKKWIKEIEENGYEEPKERETKNTDYIIA